MGQGWILGLVEDGGSTRSCIVAGSFLAKLRFKVEQWQTYESFLFERVCIVFKLLLPSEFAVFITLSLEGVMNYKVTNLLECSN